MKIPPHPNLLCESDHGAALLELALVAPVLFALLFGAVSLGRAYYVALEVTNAAHAGAEYGLLFPAESAGVAAAAKASAPEVTLGTPTVTWGCECSDGTSYYANCSTIPTCTANSTRGSNVVRRVSVTTTSVYKSFVPWPGIPSSITLSSTATIRGNYP